MDIRIKGDLDGIEAAAILKSKFLVPIVFLTAHADDATIARAKETEPHGYLLKPVRSAELRTMVAVVLYEHAMEKRQRERERWFSTTLRSIADAVIAVDLTGNVTFMNSAAEALTGMQAGTATGKPIHEVFRLVHNVEDGGGPAVELPVLTALREGRASNLEQGTLLNLSSGALRIINDSTALVIDEEAHRTLGAVMVFRDVTDQKKLQEQLELADRLASLGTMAAGVAHEVNNPLAVVVANGAFLHEELAGLQAQGTLAGAVLERIDGMIRALADLESAANRIGRIVSDLRAFSRPNPQGSSRTDVNQCIEWAIRTTSHEFHHRARLLRDLGVVPLVDADEARLGQVLINLLMNATQAIAPGRADHNEISISTRVDMLGRVVVAVRDSGEGIPKHLLAKVFEPFFTTKEIGVGTGLGLSICHGIVSAMGGEIRVDSEVGRGTTVEISLVAAAPQRPALTPSPQCAAPIAGRILLVDDDDMVLRAIKRVLRNHVVSCKDNAKDALALIEQGQFFDLILSDLMMPNMTGMDFYEHILRTRPELAQRVVFLTGGAVSAQMDDFLRSVPNLRIEKPFDIEALQALVQERLAILAVAEGSSTN